MAKTRYTAGFTTYMMQPFFEDEAMQEVVRMRLETIMPQHRMHYRRIDVSRDSVTVMFDFSGDLWLQLPLMLEDLSRSMRMMLGCDVLSPYYIADDDSIRHACRMRDHMAEQRRMADEIKEILKEEDDHVKA